MTQRQIKFRGWDGVKMYQDVVVVSSEAIRAGYEGISWKKEAKAGIPMQFTGFNDRKRTEKYPQGQEIYEGDILKAFPKSWDGNVSDKSEYNALCFWDVCGFNFKLIPETDHYGRCVDRYSHEFEIIGNQFENPELLGESND